MTTPEHDNLESLLTTALRSRPDPVPAIDLAKSAIARCAHLQTSEVRLWQLARIKRWTRLATIAAGILITVVLAIAYTRLPESTTTDATDLTTSTTASIDLTTLGVSAFLITLIAVVLVTLLTPERSQLRIAPA
jgi:hypothetical protein